MNGCLILSKNDVILKLKDACNEGAPLGLKAWTVIQKRIMEMIENAKTSPSPESQLQLIQDSLNMFYKSPTPWGRFISRMFPIGKAMILFNNDTNTQLAENKTVSSTFEETAKASRQLRQRNFLENKFKRAPNAKLYFQRNVKSDIVETFLVRRNGSDSRYYVSQKEMNESVKEYKQALLDRIFTYFESDQLLKGIVKNLPRKMYDDDDVYTGIIQEIKPVIDNHLSPEAIVQNEISLDYIYKDYRGSDKTKQKIAKQFLDAYNAWIILQNFDTVIRDTSGSIISVGNSHINQHDHDLTKYSIKNRATNMWTNWRDSDDIANMSEIISEVTQQLIETSKMYKWGANTPYQDRYLSFNDFNYIVGFIKRQAFMPTSDNIIISELNNINNLSIHTKRILADILAWNKANQYNIIRGDRDTGIPRPVTWKQLVARLNENPQKYMHAIFDILCNTNIMDTNEFIEGSSKFLNTYTKNLIWSFYKEAFGGDGNQRSLFALHTRSTQDNVYQIITQVAASTFPEDYLQYYERENGVIGTRLLKDYALDSISNTIATNIQQTLTTLSKADYKKYGITYQTRQNNKDLLEDVQINVKINNDLNFNISIDNNKVTIPEYSSKEAELIWNNHTVQTLFKDLLGLNFEYDPDFKEAYLETVSSYPAAIKNLGQLLGRAVFNTIINTQFIPKYLNQQNNVSIIKNFIKSQFGDVHGAKYADKFNTVTGEMPIIHPDRKSVDLNNLALATALNNNLLAQAQSKTGEGTSLANYTLSRMRNFYQNQLEIQCKKVNSAVKDLSFVVNSNGLFEGILSRRELKTLNSNQQSTKFSDQQSFELSFINDFVSAFVPNPNSESIIKDGKVSFLPTVNSDKTQIDGLLVNLNAKSKVNGKSYLELMDSDIEQEMVEEFSPMYERIITNINTELSKVASILNINVSGLGGSILQQNEILLDLINTEFAHDKSLGKKPKERIINGLHKVITEYNKTHSRNPIMLAEHVHYTFNKEGLLTINKTLQALHGRFGKNISESDRVNIAALYSAEPDYINYLQRQGLTDVVGKESFFSYQDYLSIENLLKMHFKVYLRGSDNVVRTNQPEIAFLRGEAVFTDDQKRMQPYLVELNEQMKNWVDDAGMMIIAKGYIVNPRTRKPELINITTLDQLHQATNIEIHPMLRKLNRLDYLCTQQYTVATVGSHYVHKGSAGVGSIITEEAKRWLASNKRNVAATSTVHLFQNKQLDGVPSIYNIAIIEDIRTDLYNIMGDLYLEGHAPLDGGMFVNAWMSELENNSLAGEAAGWDKKQFGTFYSELYGAGGIVKTAGFAPTNERMRRSEAWQNLQRNMTSRPWVKELTDENGNDIYEILDITKCDYRGTSIDYTQAIGGKPIMYKRVAHDNPQQLAAYRLENIKSLGNNQYEIAEVEINKNGTEISEPITRIETINSNWDLYTKVFGGYNSLELNTNNTLTWSENSIKLMVYAMNNVGYKKQESVNTTDYGLDQDDVWLPLKYSDIHYTPNIGAIKSLQFNVNPDGEAVLNSETTLNFMQMRLAQLGIQLDKEHHADNSEVSMPTQLMQASANRSFTHEYAQEMYKALFILTRQETEGFLSGINDIITASTDSKNPQAKLVEEVTNLIVDKLLHESSEDNSVNAILKDLLEKAEAGKTITFADDIKGKIPWSDPTIFNKLFSELSTTLTNIAVKMKFSGTLSVICPTGGVEKRYGDRGLNSFTQVYDKNRTDGSTRTSLSETSLQEYQEQVKNVNEVDSDGHNMLIYDTSRASNLRPIEGELDESYSRRVKLSQVSELKTQHNYIVEFADGSQEEITINTPEDYYRVKNLTLLGKKISTPILWAHPAIGKTYSVENGGFSDKLVDWDVEFNRKRDLWIAQQSKTLLNSDDFKRARNEYLINWTDHPEYIDFVKDEWERVKQKANRENKILVASPHMLLQLFPQDFTKVITMSEGDFVTRNIARNANNRENSLKWKAGIDQTIINYIHNSSENRQKVVTVQDNEYLENLLLNGNLDDELTQLSNNVLFENGNIAVIKVYENVQKGRELSAYNVRFSDSVSGERFQIFDLDSINLLYKLNNISDKQIKGYPEFSKLTTQQQQVILNQIFKSSAFNVEAVFSGLQADYPNLPMFDQNFMANIKQLYPGDAYMGVIQKLYKIAKPRVYSRMQNDLFKLSANYKGKDRIVWVNGKQIEPMDFQYDAYEVILPMTYKTKFGLQEYDDLQEILRDPDFFVKRGLQRFKSKIDDSMFDYELKNFNGNHVYILDSSKGIPEEFQSAIQAFETKQSKGKTYRIDSDGNIIYQMSSDNDSICSFNGIEVIVTDNPLFYVQNFNYNTLRVSPKRVTEESYQTLIETLSQSKRANSKNFLKAISNVKGEYMDISKFKQFNTAIDELNYDNVHLNTEIDDEFKSISQIYRIILQNGKELHTSFAQSLEFVAGRIPAQSQQSFMTQRVVGFDSSGLNTAMVSTFQLFLQGSDLDIDAVTLLGYDFDDHGKLIGWSPYFSLESKEMLKASKQLPLPTGKTQEVVTGENTKHNFFEIYDKYFGTLFKTIPIGNGKIKTIDGVPELQLDIYTPRGIELLSEFLRDVEKYGIGIKAELNENGFIEADEQFFKAPNIILGDGTQSTREWNLFRKPQNGGTVNVRHDQTYAIAQQLVKFVNDHNEYINTVDEYKKDSMAKNYIVNYLYKVAESPCNQTEAMKSVDESTKVLKAGAAQFAEKSGESRHAPGRVTSKVMMIGEGQAGKDGVGIGAVGIKANSTTQFYLSELWRNGSEQDKRKILFTRGKSIDGKYYRGFANMYTDQEFSEEEVQKFSLAMSLLDNLREEGDLTKDVAEQIAAMLSIAVDNAKDLALAKINSGPRLMGMYVYGMTLGIPTETLIKIMTSPEGLILKEMTEGSYFNRDTNAFRILDVFDKLNGNIGRDLERFSYIAKTDDGKVVKYLTDIWLENGGYFQTVTTSDVIFEALYNPYIKWYDTNWSAIHKTKHPAQNLNQMLAHILSVPGLFDVLYQEARRNLTNTYQTRIQGVVKPEIAQNWMAAIKQTINYIQDIANKNKVLYAKNGRGSDLRILAEGAEEMRVLGSILSMNKGLKPTPAEAEAFVDVIENLIYDRKKIMGYEPSESDKIDFIKFMTDPRYQESVVNEYEKVKHSVNIPHLLTKVPHFKGYVETQMIPIVFEMVASVKYRTLQKYRKNINADSKVQAISLFKYFDVNSKKDKESILRGLENLVQYKLLTGWLFDRKLQFTIPAGFQYFDKTGKIITSDKPEVINLWTKEGLATFKKYMDEVFIPNLKNNPNISSINEFVKNLIKISYDKTPTHSPTVVYSLQGDLMSRKGRQAELNQAMFADFQLLGDQAFNEGIGFNSLFDAFYLYAQYCYMGRKGTKSLMGLFDSDNVRGGLAKSFSEYVANMDIDGNIFVSNEELTAWCAPVGTQNLKSNFGWIKGKDTVGIQLKQKIDPNQRLSDEEMDLLYEEDSNDGYTPRYRDKFGTYKSHFLTHYDRTVKNNILVPITQDSTMYQVTGKIQLHPESKHHSINVQFTNDVITNLIWDAQFNSEIEEQYINVDNAKFNSIDDFRQQLLEDLKGVHFPYKVSLSATEMKQVDLSILQTIIKQKLEC